MPQAVENSNLTKTLTGAGFALTAALTFACTDAFVKISENGLSIWQIALGRCLFGLIVLSALSGVREFSLLGHNRLILFLSGLAGAATFILVGLAVRMLPLSEALILLYLFPAFSALLSPWLTGDRIPAKNWLWIGTAFLGTMILLWPSGAGRGLGWGHLISLSSGVTIAFSIVLLRRLGSRESAFTAHFHYCLIGALAGLAPLFFSPGSILPESPDSWLWLIGISITALVANLAMNKSVHFISAPKSGVILMVEVVAGAAFGVLFFGEHLTPRFGIGALFVLIGGILLTLQPTRQSSRHRSIRSHPVQDQE